MIIRPTVRQVLGVMRGPQAEALPWESRAPTGAPASAPTNTQAPTLGGGTYAGSSPAITPGTWTGSPTLTYSLEVDDVEVASGTEAEVEAYVYAIADEGKDAQLREIPNGNTANQASSGTVRIWNPLEDSGIKLWLRADKGITLVSTKVSAWASQAGDAALTQATDANRFTLVSSDSNFNGRATLSGAGSAWLRDASFTSIAQPYMAIAIARVTSGTTAILVDDGGGNADSPAIFFSSGTWKASAGSNMDSGDTTMGGVRAHLLDANGNTSSYYIDDFTTAKMANAVGGTNASNSLTIGANNSGAGGINGQFAELIITSTRGQTQRNKYRDYLNAFYARSIV